MAGELQYITIKDFSPGIRHRTLREGGEVSPQPLGAATRQNTYSCFALPGGGLAPLPRRSFEYGRVALEADINRVQGGKYRVSGFHTTGPVTGTGDGHSAVEFHLAYEYLYDSDDNGSFDKRKWRWERICGWTTNLDIDLIHSVTSTETSPAANYRATRFTDFRAHPTDATQVGVPLVAAAWYSGGGGFEEVWKVFPDPSSSATVSTADVSTTKALDQLVQHQGRLVGFEQIGHAHGDPGTWTSDEHVYWTNVNRTTLSSSTASMLAQGQMTGYGAIASVSAQEMLLIKNKHGGLVVSGDLDDPTVVALPGVISTGGLKMRPIYSPVGLIYGVKHGGVYAWSGGSSSTCLSPQLEDGFWRFDNDLIDWAGTFDVWKDWVLCPNNFLYDTLTESWWRMDTTDDVQALNWQVSTHDKWAYCSTASFVSSNTPVIYGYDRSVAARNYSWKSQPLAPTVDRVVDIREIRLVAHGKGKITVTLTGADGRSRTEVLRVDASNFPTVVRRDTMIQTSYVQVRMQVDGGNNDAPIIHEISLGVRERMGIPNG